VVSATVAEYTVSEKILLAAYGLDKKGQKSFTAEDLVVASWKQFGKTFGLRGYEEKFPDSNKVLSSIMGERGLAKRGWLVKIGQKQYSFTKDGRRIAGQLLGEAVEEPEHDFLQMPREQEKFVLALLNSTAYQKFEHNQKNELGFADACRFWDINQNQFGEAVDERLDVVEKGLNELEQTLAQEDGRLSNGRLITAGDVRVLRNIHRYMQDKFDRMLNLLRARSGKR
jgi:hypothetical protein